MVLFTYGSSNDAVSVYLIYS